MQNDRFRHRSEGVLTQARKYGLVILGLVGIGLAGCAETELAAHMASVANPPSRGYYKVGAPYRINDKLYVPREDYAYDQTGIASWYGPGFHGKRTANGERFDESALTAAHPTLQMPSLVRVTNLENGRSVVLRVNDRGPFAHNRLIDVSKRAAELLGFRGQGTARVRVEVLPEESRQLAELARNGRPGNLTAPPAFEAPASPEEGPAVVAAAVPEVAPARTVALPRSGAPAPAAQPAARPGVVQAAATTDGVVVPTADPTAASTLPGQRGASADRPALELAPSSTPIVSQTAVAPTALFVQAGAFSIYDNAERLRGRLAELAPVVISPATIKGTEYYRVRLGPLTSVEEADRVLASVIDTGETGAHIIVE
ncbi:MAG: septal ring lytic transglycosylase RlpA family protein [Inquilinaceae bacterium]